METGLFIGRFQPFHNGHLKSITNISNELDELVIGVGSADSSHTSENPFTAGERIRMIDKSLELEETNVYIVPIVDIERNSVWVGHVESLCPRFDTVYTNNNLVSRLFKESGYNLENHEKVRRDELSGTEVRRRIVEDENWEALVPTEVSKHITRIDGVQRLKMISD